MTNLDVLQARFERSIGDAEQMADLLYRDFIPNYCAGRACNERACRDCFRDWLLEEADEV